MKIRLRNAIYLPQKRLVFVYVPKVACTNWKAILRFLNSGAEDYLNPQLAHDRQHSGLIYLNSVPEAEQVLHNPAVKKYAFVRNPYSRVLSAFLNKFSEKVCREEPHFNRVYQEVAAYKEAHKLDPDQEGITFYAFLHWLRYAETTLTFDEHWLPQTQIIGEDLSLYENVGHFESLDTDARSVLDAIGFEGPFPTQTDVKFKPTNAIAKLRAYYGEREQALVREIYRKDFGLLRYSTDFEKALS